MNHQNRLPLEDIRIIDLTQVMAGPYCTMILGDLGANVIKVEPPGGDYSRSTPPHFHQEDSAYYLSLNKNKKSIVINLKQPEGLNILYDLVKKSDVVVDNYRPGVMNKLKLDHETLKQYNDKIISCSITGFGSDSPYANRPAYDLLIQAMGGAMSFTGEPEGAPVRMGLPMGDLAAGMFAVMGILSALHARDRFGVGQRVDISMLDCQIALMTYRAQYYFLEGEVPKPVGSGHVSAVPIRAFKTKDDWLAIDSAGDQFWAPLCRALGLDQLIKNEKFTTRAKRLKHKDELMDLLEKTFATNTREAWLKRLLEEGVPCGPVNNLEEALSDPSILKRDMVVETERFGDELKVLGSPIKMSETRCEKHQAAPALGQNTEEILKGILNYSDDRVDELLREKAVKAYKFNPDEG